MKKKLSEVTKKATLAEQNSETTLTDNISQAISNVVLLHYSRYGEKQVGQEIADVVWSYNFMNGVVQDKLSKRAQSDLMKFFLQQKY